MLSGGSAISLAVAVRQRLQAHLDNLMISLIDERYGPVGHPDSNWRQLEKAGFNFKGISAYPVLDGLDISTTTASFNKFLQESLDTKHYIIGLLGMGTDGHTAGLLPGSPALEASSLAASYEASDFQRITITPRFIEKMNEAYLYAVGPSKHRQLKQLEENLPVKQQPAQVLKRINNLTVINDIKGEVL
jgi:6-phosphogluconolactonase/glucosamine-6-phosphate isomerase/deaminase